LLTTSTIVFVDRDEVMARRLAAHGLVRRRAAGQEAAAAAACGLPDSPAGSARDSLAARVDGVGRGRSTGSSPCGPRGATYVVVPEDVEVFTRGALAARRGGRAQARGRRRTVAGPRRLVRGRRDRRHREAMRDVVAAADGPVGRDALHEALRRRLPGELLWWCRGCGSHHAHPSLWRAAGLRGRSCTASRPTAPSPSGAGRARPAQRRGRAARARHPRPALPRPADGVELGGWLGTGTAHAKALLSLVETRPVDRAGRRALDLAEPPPVPAERPRGLRLLGAADPLLDTRDRETVVPDPAARKVLWPAIGRPGAVLADGEVVGRGARGRAAAGSRSAWSASPPSTTPAWTPSGGARRRTRPRARPRAGVASPDDAGAPDPP
jgi:hypothetical protein